MTETRRKQLHLGKCIEDLDELYNIPDLKTKKANMLCKTAQKLFDIAEQYREKGDEEHSYVCYMKYLRVIAFLSKDEEYLRNKKYYNDMLGIKNPGKAMDAAELLKSSLIERYTKQAEIKRINEAKESEFKNKKVEEARKKTIESLNVKNELVLDLPDPDEVSISSEQLYKVLKSGKLRVMILDARPEKDYLESHIKYPACISVPEEVISPGRSANILEQNLPAASKAVWSSRAQMELIALLDWSSQKPIPGQTLHLLKTILLKWDTKVQYARSPLVLWGGYEEWLLRYPALTTNPQVVPPKQNDQLDDMLGEIDYPNWSDEILSPTNRSQPITIKIREPTIDRSSKAAAVQTYEERDKTIKMILDQRMKLVDTSLTLEIERIQAEQDWEKVRAEREAEQRKELQGLFQLREQEILSQLMQMESKQYDMVQENQSLRMKLEEYQRRVGEEDAKMASEGQDSSQGDSLSQQQQANKELEAQQARILLVEQQTAQLDRRRERLEAERLKRLAEARAKGKPNERDDDGDIYMVSPGDSPGSHSINRSHSSPNIAKISSDEEDITPTFDRSNKPIGKVSPDMKVRDLEPVWGAVGRGLTGLKNLGNTCYMNSIIQCLNNTTILVNYFCNGQYLEHVNRAHGTRGQIAEELAVVVRALWSGQYKFIATKDLRNSVGRFQRAFRGSEQQDSHEFLTILMDWLHTELQFNIIPPQKEPLPASEAAWQQYTKCRESLILHLFYGQMRSGVRCTQCHTPSLTYDTFSNLSLELPAHAARCTLADCLQLYLNGETVPGWNCPNCKDKRNAVKKLDISKLPPFLVIHFKRFYVDPKDYSNVYRKKQTYIDFPLEGLDMRQFSLNCSGNNVYNLYAVSNHYGSMEGGHYTAYCKSSLYGKWYKYDDHVVSEISSNDVKSSAAYILFYTSGGPHLRNS